MGVALLGDREGRADLHAGGAERERLPYLFRRVDAAGNDDRDGRDLHFVEQPLRGRQDRGKVEARVRHLLQLRRAEVAASVARVLDHDGVGQAALALPLLQHQPDGARFRQDRDQRDLGIVRGELGQVEREPRADHDGVRAARAGLAHVARVLRHGAHDVHGDQAAAAGDLARGADFAVERGQVGALDRRLVARVARRAHEVRVVAPQVDARDGADAVLARDRGGKAVRRDAHAHAALHERAHPPAADRQHRIRVRQGRPRWPRARSCRADRAGRRRRSCSCRVVPAHQRASRCARAAARAAR